MTRFERYSMLAVIVLLLFVRATLAQDTKAPEATDTKRRAALPTLVRTVDDLRSAARGKGIVRVAPGLYQVEPPLIVTAELVGFGQPTIVAKTGGELSIKSTWSALVRVQGEGGLNNFTIDCDGKVGHGISVEAVRSRIHNVRVLNFATKGIRCVHDGKRPIESLDFENLYIASNRGVNWDLLGAFQVDSRSRQCKRLRVRGITIPRNGLSHWQGKAAVAIKLAAVDDAIVEGLHTEYRWVFGENCGRIEFRDVSFGHDPEFYPDTGALRNLQSTDGMFPQTLIVRGVRKLKGFVDPNLPRTLDAAEEAALIGVDPYAETSYDTGATVGD